MPLLLGSGARWLLLEDNGRVIHCEFSGILHCAEVDSVYGVRCMTIENAFHNKYSLVKGAARRARQLQSGAVPLIVPKSMKACRVAQEEIEQGHVKFVLPKKIVEPTLDHLV